MPKAILTLLFTAIIISLKSQILDIGIFYNQEIHSIVFTPTKGSYSIICEGEKTILLKKNQTLFIEAKTKLSLKTITGTIGSFSEIKIEANESSNIFRLKPIFPNIEVRNYPGSISIHAEKNILKMVNNVFLEDYVAGVVLTESGANKPEEYYKVQAIMCRTYALGHRSKHKTDGYELCDDVHCQAYYRFDSPPDKISKAVEATRNMVIADKNNKLIQAVFHSNCGGETVNSENVWSSPSEYLVAVKDTFCSKGNHAIWSDSIPVSVFIDYLYSKGIQGEILFSEKSFIIKQDNREKYLFFGSKKLSTKDIRKDLNLKSTFFNIEQQDKILVFTGKGYGHGVGLCQEGAMEMAKCELSYRNIIQHYFKNTKIIDYTSIIK